MEYYFLQYVNKQYFQNIYSNKVTRLLNCFKAFYYNRYCIML